MMSTEHALVTLEKCFITLDLVFTFVTSNAHMFNVHSAQSSESHTSFRALYSLAFANALLPTVVQANALIYPKIKFMHCASVSMTFDNKILKNLLH
jgi:hypothetical protein